MPKPKTKETKDDYMGRCMGSKKMNAEFPRNDQRAAVCYSYWDKGLKESMSMTFKQYLTEMEYNAESIERLAKGALAKLVKIGKEGKLASVYKSVDDYLYDFYPDLPWDSVAQLKAMKIIQSDPAFKGMVADWKEKLDFDWDKEMKDAIKDVQKEIHG